MPRRSIASQQSSPWPGSETAHGSAPELLLPEGLGKPKTTFSTDVAVRPGARMGRGSSKPAGNRIKWSSPEIAWSRGAPRQGAFLGFPGVFCASRARQGQAHQIQPYTAQRSPSLAHINIMIPHRVRSWVTLMVQHPAHCTVLTSVYIYISGCGRPRITMLSSGACHFTPGGLHLPNTRNYSYLILFFQFASRPSASAQTR
jgi:hypothetical protein